MNTPSGIKTRTQGASVDTEMVAPLRECFGLAVPLNKRVVSPVIALDGAGGPSAITRFVVPVNINSVDRMQIARAWSHIFKEVQERRAPTVADRYSASAVVLESWRLGIFAASNDAAPCLMLSCLRTPVSSVSAQANVNAMAATGSCFAIAEIGGSGESGSTAIAAAAPFQSVPWVGSLRWFDDRQLAETLSCHLDPASPHMQDYKQFAVKTAKES